MLLVMTEVKTNMPALLFPWISMEEELPPTYKAPFSGMQLPREKLYYFPHLLSKKVPPPQESEAPACCGLESWTESRCTLNPRTVNNAQVQPQTAHLEKGGNRLLNGLSALFTQLKLLKSIPSYMVLFKNKHKNGFLKSPCSCPPGTLLK